MAILPSVLGSDELPLAERMAARLDGELFALGDAYCPIDTIETPALRLAALLGDRSPRLIAELSAAAWVWNAVPMLPTHLELCVDLRARARPHPVPHASIREVVIDSAEFAEFAGRRVTTPIRTAIDLARSREPFDAADQDAVRGLAHIARFGLADCLARLDERRNLPAKRRAVERLTAALGE